MHATLEPLARRELVGAQRVLVVNAPAFAHGAVTTVPSPDAALDGPADGARFEGALWVCERELAQGLVELRARLSPGARLLVAVTFRRSPWELVRDVVRGEGSPRPSFDELCEALLLQGFEEPRVLAESTAWAVVAAELPAVPDPLDDVFTQPR